MQIVNLTPHSIRLLAGDGSVLREWQAPRQPAARVHYNVRLGIVGGVEVEKKRVQGVYGLPPVRKGVGYLVSRQVAHAVKGERDDVYFMDELVTVGRTVVGGRTLAQF